MKQIEVQIMGQNYMLGCPENSEARLLEAVETVDSAMCKIRDAAKVKARDRIAVLAALNLAYQLMEPAPPMPEPVLQNPDPLSDAADGVSGASRAQLQSLLQKLDAALASQNLAA
jgi:cell division protein ZapA